MSRRLAFCIALAALVDPTFAVCPATRFEFLGNSRQFEVYQDCNFKLKVPAVEGLKTATEFYDYYSASSHTGFERTDRSFLFLYRNLNFPNELAIFWLHGIDSQPAIDQGLPRQGTAAVWGQMSGIPTGARIAQADDGPSEFDWSSELGWDRSSPTHSGPYIAGRWWFKDNTDGGSLDQLPMDQDWEMKVEVNFDATGMSADGKGKMNDWRFFFADGSDQVLQTQRPLFIRSKVPASKDNVIDYPAPLETLTFCGLAVDSNDGEIEYDFDWGDGMSNGLVKKKQGELACETHMFCHPEFGCGGVYPREVRITAKDSCGNTISKRLAFEANTATTESPTAPLDPSRICPPPPAPPSPPP
eukprot:Hpha_TRINITY_DN15188_c1_g13::TRINITY_DN15188_c1_g13_i1::g.128601::m.128601